jgi:hypothetical protein
MDPLNMNDPSGRLSVSLAIWIIEALLDRRVICDVLSADSDSAGFEARFALVSPQRQEVSVPEQRSAQSSPRRVVQSWTRCWLLT